MTKKKKILLISVISIAFLIAIPIAGSYLNYRLPFLPSKLALLLDATLGSVPGLPKTNWQILAAGFRKNGTIMSARQAGKIILKNEKTELIGVDFKGSFALNPEKFYQQDLDLSFASNQVASLQTIEKEESFFLKVTEEESLGLNLEKINGNWIRIDSKKLEEGLNAQVRTDDQLAEDIKNFFSKFFDEVSRRKWLQKSSRSQEGQLYKLRILLNKEDIKEFFPNSISFDNLVLEIFANKENQFLERIDVEAKLGEGISVPFVGNQQGLTLEFVSSISEINKDLQKDLPNDYKDKNIFELYYDLYSREKNLSSLVKNTQEVADFAANLITLQRLEHVLFLTPVSISP